MWDPIAGDYRGVDGWIRLHTNYSSHRAAVLDALWVGDADREAVAARVGRPGRSMTWSRASSRTSGAAAVMRTRDEWLAHPQGVATASAAPLEIVARPGGAGRSLPPASSPLAGVKVLDLTRVIAGPFTEHGSWPRRLPVLRLDPPGFEEVSTIVPEATAGEAVRVPRPGHDERPRPVPGSGERSRRRRARIPPGSPRTALGLDDDTLYQANRDLIVSQHDAYGWTGPWARRRGFDSLVQMSCGIAAAPGGRDPKPLPAQALDPHGPRCTSPPQCAVR